MFSIPCDYVFPCSNVRQLTGDDISLLAQNGCRGVFEGTHQAMSLEAVTTAKKRNMLHGPYRATTAGASLVNGMTLAA